MSLQERVDDLYWRKCSRKRPYKTLRSVSIAVINMRHAYPDQQFVWYECMFCGDYHVGHARTCRCCRDDGVEKTGIDERRVV